MSQWAEYQKLVDLTGIDEACFAPLGSELKVLLVWPRFPSSFWSMDGILDLVPIKTDQPPLGLLTIAALCPKTWTLRLVDRSFEDLLDTDILWADLVMVSGMRVQKDDIRETLSRARALGRRTMIGGPFASSEPESLVRIADHVVVGEPDEVFPEIAADIERGTAKRLYDIKDKPDVSKTPLPRFDLLRSWELCLHGRAVLPRLPVPMRVLRHHHHLRKEAANQAPQPVAGGTRCAV